MGVAVLLTLLFFHLRETRPLYLEGPPGSGIKLLFDRQLGWRNVPNQQGSTYGQELTTNSHGLRGPEIARPKPSDAKRILIVGDSFAWGFSVKDDDVIDRVLERRLEPLPQRWEVLNASVTGWGTDQEYLYLKQEGFDFEPDIVVLAMFLANDLENNASSVMYQRQKPLFLDLDMRLVNVPVPTPDEDTPAIRTRVDPIRLTAKIVNEMARLCKDHGSAFVPVWFGRYLEPGNKRYRDITRFFQSLLIRAPHIHPLDLDDAFHAAGADVDMLTRGGPDQHWNAVGHEIAAELLWRHLDKEGLLE